MVLSINGFPSCCGIITLSYFPCDGLRKEAWTKKGYSEMVKENQIKVINQLNKIWIREPHYAFILTVLNSNQEPIFGDILLDRGFKMLNKRKNPNSDNHLYLYLYKPKIKGLD